MRNNAIAPDGFRPLSPSIESASMVVTETSAKYYWSCLNFLLASQVVTHHATTSCYPPSTIFLHRADIITIILSRATTVNISSQVAVMCVGGPTVRMVSIQLPPQSSPPTGRRGKDKAILQHAILSYLIDGVTMTVQGSRRVVRGSQHAGECPIQATKR